MTPRLEKHEETGEWRLLGERSPGVFFNLRTPVSAVSKNLIRKLNIPCDKVTYGYSMITNPEEYYDKVVSEKNIKFNIVMIFTNGKWFKSVLQHNEKLYFTSSTHKNTKCDCKTTKALDDEYVVTNSGILAPAIFWETLIKKLNDDTVEEEPDLRKLIMELSKKIDKLMEKLN
jgi:hypothetical protein